MDDVEDLSSNIFLQVLQRSPLYATACAEGHTLIVPVNSALVGHTITAQLLSDHVVRPSPYFVGQFESHSGKSVSLSSSQVTTGKGYGEVGRTCTVVTEETVFGHEGGSFRILCVDKPLEGALVDGSGYSVFSKTRSTEAEHVAFLARSPEFNGPAMARLAEQVRDFNEKYVLVHGFEASTVRKLRVLVGEALAELVAANPQYASCRSIKSHMQSLRSSVEAVVLGGVHDKVMAFLAKTHAADDLRAARSAVAGIADGSLSPKALGVREEFCCPVPAGVERLRGLAQVRTVREKLDVVKATTGLITKAVEAKLDALPSGRGGLSFATDDLLPFLIHVTAAANPPHLASTVAFLREFQLTQGDSSNEQSFLQVTFEAAVRYLVDLTPEDQVRDSLALKRSASQENNHQKEPIIPAPVAKRAIDQRKSRSDSAPPLSSRASAASSAAAAAVQQPPAKTIPITDKPPEDDFLAMLKRSKTGSGKF
jgi:hypothetical protein